MRGINLATMFWTDGDAPWPCDYRLADPADAKTKNDHFRDMLAAAKARRLAPWVLFDSWYSGRENLKAVRDHGWTFLTRVLCNSRVGIDSGGKRPIAEMPIAASGTVVHVGGFGLVKAFRVALTNGGAEHWVTDDLSMDSLGRLAGSTHRNHVGLAIRAFVRLEWALFRHGVSWFQAKWSIIREAVRAYLANPTMGPPPPRTAKLLCQWASRLRCLLQSRCRRDAHTTIPK